MAPRGVPESNSDDIRRLASESVDRLADDLRELDKRVRRIETDELHEVRKLLYCLENRVANFSSAHDDRKERWKIALNFVVQLIWVVMASYVLTKLGISMGPV